MRICWVHPTAKVPEMESLWSTIEGAMESVPAPGNSIEYRFCQDSANFTRSLYAEHMNSVLMLDQAIQAEKDGCQGVFLGCWNDALWEAREMLNIPVASVGEQSMLAAMAIGQRFAVITVSEKTVVAIERDINAYNFRDRAIQRPARSIFPESDGNVLMGSVTDPFETFIPRFEKTALECIADGADVILVGCAYFGPLLRKAGYTHIANTGVPVVDSSSVAIKYLEAMMGIAEKVGVVKSQRSTFRTPDSEKTSRARASVNNLEAQLQR